MKIQKIFVDITFEDGSTTFNNFSKAEGARQWLEPYEGVGEDPGEEEDGREEGGDSEKRSDLEAEGVKIEE